MLTRGLLGRGSDLRPRYCSRDHRGVRCQDRRHSGNRRPRRRDGSAQRLWLFASLHLLNGPAIAVWIAEEQEQAPGELLHLADLHSSLDELRTCGVDVRDDELQALDRAWRHV